MSDVDEIKSRVNIVDVIGAKMTLKKAGRHFKGLCPFHNEKTPSFIVSPERQIWKCFGCGKGGSVIDFVMEYDHVDFIESLESLAELAGIKLERRPQDTPESKLKSRLFEVNHLASEFYQYLLTSHRLGENARDYLKRRGVSDKSIKTFSLGYSPNSWDGLLKYLKKKGYEQKILEQAGLIVSSARGGYDRFRGRVMFTLKDHRENVIGFSGRLLDPDAKEAKYINTSETTIYNKSSVLYGLDVTKASIQKENEAILTEGEFDVISLFQAGVSNVVAIKGSALTQGHVNLLRRFTERLLFALDSDVAGDAASRRGIEIADRGGLDMKIIVLPSGKDPDEAVRENPELFKKAIKQAIPIYDYFITSAQKRFDVESAFGKKKIAEELLPIWAKIENPIVQNHYVKKLAKTIDSDVASLLEQMSAQGGSASGGKKLERFSHTQSDTPKSKLKSVSTPAEKLEIYLLALLLQGNTKELYEEFKEQVVFSDITHNPVRKILEHLDEYLKKQGSFFIKDFAKNLPQELHASLDEAFLWDVSDITDDEEKFRRQWYWTLNQYQRQVLHRNIHTLTQTLRGSVGEENSIGKQLRTFTNQLRKLETTS